MRRLILSEAELLVIHHALVTYPYRDRLRRNAKAWETALTEIARTMHDETMLVDPLTGDLINDPSMGDDPWNEWRTT